MAPASPYVTGLVVAAGGSKRLGHPKQLLPYGETTQLGHVLDLARECPFDQRLCVIGGGAQHVRATVDLTGIDVVDNPEYDRAAPLECGRGRRRSILAPTSSW
jgi:molybdenum cofactor cytidylyltransferase